MLMLHFLQLVCRYAGLECEQVFGLYTVSFIEDLTPAVFAGCLCPKESQVICWKEEIMVFFRAGKQEIWALLVFGNCLLLKSKFGCSEDVGQVMLQ